MAEKNSSWYVKVLMVGIAIIMIIAPFYAPLSVLVASHLQHFDFWKIWKELALASLAATVLIFLPTHKEFARKVLRNKLALAIGLYVLLIIAVGTYDLATHRVSSKAIIYGWLIDIRPVGFLAITFLAIAMGAQKKLAAFNWKKVVLIPAMAVIVFGFLQITVLPKNILSHIGYSTSTITPYQTVDNQPGIVRIESTLRGPNPLGAYLVVIITLLVSMFFTDKKRRFFWGLSIALALAVTFRTYSRSAEIGLVLSLAILLIMAERKVIGQHLVAAGAVAGLLVIAGLLASLQNNYFAQNILFHSSNVSTSSLSSNAQRSEAIKTGVRDVVHRPLGSGVGSAGPASGRNAKGGLRLSENYFLQIGQELGIVGMILFIAINILIGRGLWRQRNYELARVLLASLIGLTFVNMVSHAWTDDTLAYIWWGLAGIALVPDILKANKLK